MRVFITAVRDIDFSHSKEAITSKIGMKCLSESRSICNCVMTYDVPEEYSGYSKYATAILIADKIKEIVHTDNLSWINVNIGIIDISVYPGYDGTYITSFSNSEDECTHIDLAEEVKKVIGDVQ